MASRPLAALLSCFALMGCGGGAFLGPTPNVTVGGAAPPAVAAAEPETLPAPGATYVRETDIPSGDFCMVRARTFQGFVPMRCEDVAKTPRIP